jgi:hypothetical protein
MAPGCPSITPRSCPHSGGIPLGVRWGSAAVCRVCAGQCAWYGAGTGELMLISALVAPGSINVFAGFWGLGGVPPSIVNSSVRHLRGRNSAPRASLAPVPVGVYVH